MIITQQTKLASGSHSDDEVMEGQERQPAPSEQTVRAQKKVEQIQSLINFCQTRLDEASQQILNVVEEISTHCASEDQAFNSATTLLREKL